MKESDKQNSHISSRLCVIYVSSNDVTYPVTNTFTTLHPITLNSISLHLLTLKFLSFKLHPTTLHCTSPNYTSLHFTQLHFTTLSFGLTLFKSPSAPFHFCNSPHSAAVLTSWRLMQCWQADDWPLFIQSEQSVGRNGTTNCDCEFKGKAKSNHQCHNS